jgi:hypothetical protein
VGRPVVTSRPASPLGRLRTATTEPSRSRSSSHSLDQRRIRPAVHGSCTASSPASAGAPRITRLRWLCARAAPCGVMTKRPRSRDGSTAPHWSASEWSAVPLPVRHHPAGRPISDRGGEGVQRRPLCRVLFRGGGRGGGGARTAAGVPGPPPDFYGRIS